MMNILNIKLPKPSNLISLKIEKYDYETFQDISKSVEFIQKFKGREWNTNAYNKFSHLELRKNAQKFDFINHKQFEFWQFNNLKEIVKNRTKKFEEINWVVSTSLHYYSSKELYQFEIWLEQIEWIDEQFSKNVVF